MNYGSLIPEYTRLMNDTPAQNTVAEQSLLRYLLDAWRNWRTSA